MDTKENFSCYIHKDSKVIDAIYILGRYFDPDLIALQIEKTVAITATGIGIGFFIITAIF